MTRPPLDEERALGNTDQGHTNDEHAQHGSQTNNISSTNLDYAATSGTSDNTIDADSDESDDGDEDAPLMRKTKLRQRQSAPDVESSKTKATWADWSRSTGLHPQTWTRHTYIKGTLLLVLLTAIILAFAVVRVQDHIKEILKYVVITQKRKKEERSGNDMFAYQSATYKPFSPPLLYRRIVFCHE